VKEKNDTEEINSHKDIKKTKKEKTAEKGRPQTQKEE